MTTLLTPGIYRQPVEPVRAMGRLARGDVPVLLGYAVRGPLLSPVRIESLRQFEEIFGPVLPHGRLWHGLKGFFETGGRAAYVLRLAEKTARAARVDLTPASALTWRAEASFPWLMIDPRKLRGAGQAGAAPWVQVFERLIRGGKTRSPDPGGWGNGCAILIRRAARVQTETLPETVEDGRASRLASLAGLEMASVLSLSQTGADGVTRSVVLRPAGLDRERLLLRWDVPLSATPSPDGPVAFDPERPIRIESAEFDVEIYANGQLEQAFTALAPHPDHSRAITRVMGEGCRSVNLRPMPLRKAGGVWTNEHPEQVASRLAGVDWSDPDNWPREGLFTLAGGSDGLERIGAEDDVGLAVFRAALPEIARLSEVAMIAAPDLVLRDALPRAPEPTPPEPVDCSNLTSQPEGQLLGLVVGEDAVGMETSLAGVEVDVEGPGGRARTGADGQFSLSGIRLGLVTLRLTRPGYEPLEHLAQSISFAPDSAERITMNRISLPQALPETEVLLIQQDLANPEKVGPYKIAILDAPAPDAENDALLTWRARLGDSARMAFFAPWLRVPDAAAEGGVIACPPSGHVCGAIAAAEIVGGMSLSGANLALRHADGVTRAIGDAEQAGLNPAGINAVRSFPGRGTRVFGARTLSSDPSWRYLTARRIVDAIEKTLERALHWMVFEPNNLITRHAVSTTAASFLDRLWRAGILAGDRAEAAYSVKCDLENNPDESRAEGKLVADIAVAPTKPYEFILFRLGHARDAIKVTETEP